MILRPLWATKNAKPSMILYDVHPYRKKTELNIFVMFSPILGGFGTTAKFSSSTVKFKITTQGPRRDHAPNPVGFDFFPLKWFCVAQAYFVLIETSICSSIMAHSVHLGLSRPYAPYSHCNHDYSSNSSSLLYSSCCWPSGIDTECVIKLQAGWKMISQDLFSIT